MSTYEWERGTLKIPASQFSRFKRDFIDRYNGIMERRYNAAYDLWNQLRTEAKGKRGFDYHKRFEEITANAPSKYEGIEAHDLFPRGGQERKPKMPKRASFPKATYKTSEFSIDGNGRVVFFPETREVLWDVYENNHAVEAARESAVGVLFFKVLGSVKWTRGSGGVITGNNEYNQGDQPGDGANYVTQRFGPLGEERRTRRARR